SETAIAGTVVRRRGFDRLLGKWCVHVGSRVDESAAANVGPFLDGKLAEHRLQQEHARCFGAKPISRALRQERLVSALAPEVAHFPAERRSGDAYGAVLIRRYDLFGSVQLYELYLDLTVHDDREFVVCGRVPVRGPFGPKSLEHV